MGKRERQPERDSPNPPFSVSEVRLPRVRVKRIFACVHVYTGCSVLMCEHAAVSSAGIMGVGGGARPENASEGDFIGFEGMTGHAC